MSSSQSELTNENALIHKFIDNLIIFMYLYINVWSQFNKEEQVGICMTNDDRTCLDNRIWLSFDKLMKDKIKTE